MGPGTAHRRQDVYQARGRTQPRSLHTDARSFRIPMSSATAARRASPTIQLFLTCLHILLVILAEEPSKDVSASLVDFVSCNHTN